MGMSVTCRLTTNYMELALPTPHIKQERLKRQTTKLVEFIILPALALALPTCPSADLPTLTIVGCLYCGMARENDELGIPHTRIRNPEPAPKVVSRLQDTKY
jgi:hypothetical protein